MMVQRLLAGLDQLMRSWAKAKFGIEQSVPFGDSWLHLIIGPLIFLGAALVMRQPLSSCWPWLVVAALASLNEFIDHTVEVWPGSAVDSGDSVSDFLLTIALPTVILLVARYFPRFRKGNGGPSRTGFD